VKWKSWFMVISADFEKQKQYFVEKNIDLSKKSGFIAISFYGIMFLSQYGLWKLLVCREPNWPEEKWNCCDPPPDLSGSMIPPPSPGFKTTISFLATLTKKASPFNINYFWNALSSLLLI
jgi:hypothetical protein